MVKIVGGWRKDEENRRIFRILKNKRNIWNFVLCSWKIDSVFKSSCFHIYTEEWYVENGKNVAAKVFWSERIVVY